MIRLTMSCRRQLTSAAEFFPWRLLAVWMKGCVISGYARSALSVFDKSAEKQQKQIVNFIYAMVWERHFRVSRKLS